MNFLFCKVIWRKIMYYIFWRFRPFRLGRLCIFLLCRDFMTFTLLLTAILILLNKTEYTINDDDSFSRILSDLISFLDSFFSWYLLSNSCSMIILPMRFFNSCFLFVLIVVLLQKLVIDVLVSIIWCILYQVWSFQTFFKDFEMIAKCASF